MLITTGLTNAYRRCLAMAYAGKPLDPAIVDAIETEIVTDIGRTPVGEFDIPDAEGVRDRAVAALQKQFGVIRRDLQH
ncbi:hypothetical protein [Pseudoxanthobacter soli]|nr:hypothetical protein [Pseudoxanthobacter soli]